MKNVALIGTYHDERGRASASELHSILERIQPDVIFIEAPAEWDGSRYLREKPDGLESRAISLYIVGRSVDLVPVDLPTPDESFFRMTGYLFRDLPKTSYEYYRLLEDHKENVFVRGFLYLNSDDHIRSQSYLHAETMKSLEKLKNRGFSESYETWLKTIELRDQAMVSNIGSYCQNHEFKTAVFLVGAAHRPSIIEKSKDKSSLNCSEIQWDFSGGGAW